MRAVLGDLSSPRRGREKTRYASGFTQETGSAFSPQVSKLKNYSSEAIRQRRLADAHVGRATQLTKLRFR